MPGEDQATLNTGLDSSAMQQLDPQENPGGEDVVSTIGDEVGGIDISSGGTHAQPKEDTGKEAEQGKAGEEKAGDEKKAGEGEGAQAEEGKKGEGEAGKQDTKTDDTGDDKAKPFHEHPDWQRMVKERNEAREALKAATDEIAQIKEQVQTLQGGEDGVKSKLLEMSDDELRELFDDEPKSFVTQLINTLNAEAQTRETTARTAAEQKELSDGIDATYEAFEKENPDFTEKWNKGELQEFMSKHPGHTPISAYLALDREANASTMEQRIKDEVAKKEKEIEARIRKEYRAKVHSDVLGDGPSATPMDGDDAELQNADKHGGLVNVQVKRLERMRAQGE